MRFNLKIAVVIVIAILLISTGYYIFFIREKDAEAPTIDSITGDISAEQGESIDISVSFSDNENRRFRYLE